MQGVPFKLVCFVAPGRNINKVFQIKVVSYQIVFILKLYRPSLYFPGSTQLAIKNTCSDSRTVLKFLHVFLKNKAFAGHSEIFNTKE